jgi:pimeloyl-ACP methyl ester carboxylesterase
MQNFLPKFIGFFLNIIGYLNLKLASKWALDLFSKPLKGRYKIKHTTLETANKEVIYFEELPIATYRWYGEKETILLAHGWESNAGRWNNTIKNLLKSNYGVIALDAPAHGASGSTSFNAVLYSKFIEVVCKKFKPSVLIGHSVGGMAISFFLRNSGYHLASKLIFLGAPAGFPGIFKNYTDLMGFNSRVRRGIEERVVRKFGQPSAYFNTAQFMSKIDCDGLIIHDQNDNVIPYTDAVEIQAAFKNSALITTNGLGHGLKGKLIIQYILDFLED